MSQVQPIPHLKGIHLTISPWLPPPDGDKFSGWIKVKQNPDEYLVHPLALEALRKHLGLPPEAVVPPEETARKAFELGPQMPSPPQKRR